MQQDTQPVVHVAVGHGRRIVEPPGVRVHRMRALDRRARWHLSPPRLRIEDAVLDVAGAASDELGAIAALTDVVQRRLTTYAAIQCTLAERIRSPVSRHADSAASAAGQQPKTATQVFCFHDSGPV